MSAKIFSLSFQERTLKKVDSIRGLVPRSTYIENIISIHLKNQNKETLTPSESRPKVGRNHPKRKEAERPE